MAGAWRVSTPWSIGTWLGLLISFSQSSFVALAAGIVVAVAVAWGRRATVALVALGAVTTVVLLAVPQVRHELLGKSRSGVNRITSGRANLVGQGLRITLDHPITGVGAGGFSHEYQRRSGSPASDPKRVASHTMPVTVAAELGVVGLALLAWLLAAALLATLRGLGRGFTSRVALATGVVLVAIGDPQPVLRGVLRGSDDVGAPRPRRPLGAGAEEDGADRPAHTGRAAGRARRCRSPAPTATA